jgi:hypothetical protein
VGVSGSTVPNDIKVAQAAVIVFEGQESLVFSSDSKTFKIYNLIKLALVINENIKIVVSNNHYDNNYYITTISYGL